MHSSGSFEHAYSPLPRPWSHPMGGTVGRASRVRRAVGTGALCIASLLAGAGVGFVGASPAEAAQGDPPCGFDVYRGRLYVTSLSARGSIDVWIGDRLVRSGRSIAAGETEVFRLKRRHSSADFTVAIVATGRKHNDEQVSWCEPA